MRKPERIGPIVKLVEEIWHRYPDFRLTQLVHNAVSLELPHMHGKDQFYVEDEELLRGLEKLKSQLMYCGGECEKKKTR